ASSPIVAVDLPVIIAIVSPAFTFVRAVFWRLSFFPVRAADYHPSGQQVLTHKARLESSGPNTNSNGPIRTNTRILLPGDLFT
ncbi:hypothetical protein LNK20_21530, partial [Bacillus safensis]|nr:hypothetical protein [Bacillus safensis]